MHSRARKIGRTDSDFDTLHHQLNSDFEVHLYLTDQQNQQYSLLDAAATLADTLLSSTHSCCDVDKKPTHCKDCKPPTSPHSPITSRWNTRNSGSCRNGRGRKKR